MFAIFFFSFRRLPVRGKRKTPARQQNNCLPGQELKDPAVPPGLTAIRRPLTRTDHTLPFGYGEAAPSHILCTSCQTGSAHFRLPSEVHSTTVSSAALTPPAARWGNRDRAYSLFLNGLFYYNTTETVCQVFFCGKIRTGLNCT